MRRPIIATVTIGMLSLSAAATQPAFAKGGQDNFERQQALQAELKKLRDAKPDEASPSFFERFFGSDAQQDGKTSKQKDAPKDAE